MRAVLQRVRSASVSTVEEGTVQIGKGLLVLVGIEADDNAEDVRWLCAKIVQMRIFDDENGLMNRSVQDVDGELLVVSQFTLFASTKKGNRPSFIRAARPEVAIPIYESIKEELTTLMAKSIRTGVFGADMLVSLENSGPVTIIIDTKNKE
jgi:D-aminoacyl-tRNA deacylase